MTRTNRDKTHTPSHSRAHIFITRPPAPVATILGALLRRRAALDDVSQDVHVPGRDDHLRVRVLIPETTGHLPYASGMPTLPSS